MIIHLINFLAQDEEANRMLFFSFGESQEHLVEIEGVDPKILKSLIEFCSTSKISINSENVYEVFNAANR